MLRRLQGCDALGKPCLHQMTRLVASSSCSGCRRSFQNGVCLQYGKDCYLDIMEKAPYQVGGMLSLSTYGLYGDSHYLEKMWVARAG